MSFWIPRCFDSHVHLMGTGQEREGLPLASLRSIEDLSKLEVKPHHFRGDWLVAFGWDHFKMNQGVLPHRQDLDKVFPHTPVYFVRRDGHAAWVNSAAIQRAKLIPQIISGGEVVLDAKGEPTGILIDRAMALVKGLLPEIDRASQRHFLQEAVNIFNAAGFTHIRDMGGSEVQWQILAQMDQENSLSLYVEQNFTFDTMINFEKSLRAAEVCRQEKHRHLRLAGVKCFIDGALGSEGAWLSQKYPHSPSSGLQLWNSEELSEILSRAWSKKIDVAVHALGDEAVDFLATTALQVQKKNIHGQLHVEHAEVVRPETAKKLKSIGAKVHMQPCHWLSDKTFLKEKLGPLFKNVFPWSTLQQEGVQLQWGSDAPIEKPSVFSNLHALEDSAQAGVTAFRGDPRKLHEHPDQNWGKDCKTEFTDTPEKTIRQVLFDGEKIL